MVIELKLHWAIRFGITLVVINAPVVYFWYRPLRSKRLDDKRIHRLKNYQQVRMKSFDDIQVWTEEAERAKKDVEENGPPLALYSSFPTDEEIDKYGLYVIGKELAK